SRVIVGKTTGGNDPNRRRLRRLEQELEAAPPAQGAAGKNTELSPRETIPAVRTEIGRVVGKDNRFLLMLSAVELSSPWLRAQNSIGRFTRLVGNMAQDHAQCRVRPMYPQVQFIARIQQQGRKKPPSPIFDHVKDFFIDRNHQPAGMSGQRPGNKFPESEKEFCGAQTRIRRLVPDLPEPARGGRLPRLGKAV